MIKKDNQPICRINEYGDKFYRLNNILHREDGPAYESSEGSKRWYLNGLLHREDGPAVEYSWGIKYWYYHGEKIDVSSQEEFKRLIKLKTLW